MNWLVFHIVSGHAFFSGVILIVLAVLASISKRSTLNRITVLVFLVGVIAIVLSSAAIPYWIYAVATTVTLAWIASRFHVPWRRWTAYLTIAAWLIVAIIEIPYHLTDSLDPTPNRRVTILGDSVSAGLGGNETWPSIMGREHQLEVQDISRVGETVSSALARAKASVITGDVVIVELGGNDILGSTTSHQFARDLDELFESITEANRQIIMFEMPLPPFGHAFGRAQRTLAAKHSVTLIPKYVFLSVIAGDDFTLDSVHLTELGHQFMADCVWRLVRTAFSSENAAYPNMHSN